MTCFLVRRIQTYAILEEWDRKKPEPHVIRGLGAVCCIVATVGALIVAKRGGNWQRFGLLSGIPSLSLSFFGATIDNMRIERSKQKRNAQILAIWADAADCDKCGHRKPYVPYFLEGRAPYRPFISYYR